MKNISRKVFLYAFVLLSTALNIVMAIKLYNFHLTKNIYVDTKNSNVVKDNKSDYKDNPIDKYIDKELANDNLTYAEVRNTKRLYGILWEEEFGSVIDFLKKQYGNEGKIKDLDKEIEKYVEKMIKVVEVIYYDTDEVSQEKKLGLSDWADMQYTKGQIYRDVCMFLITNLVEDYTFLEKDYQKIVIP